MTIADHMIDSLMVENDDLRERIAELEAENENLLRTVDSVMPSLIEDNAKLKVENEMLRELVRDMFEEIEAGGFDPMVERHGKSTVYYEEDPSWRVGIRERMRELGVEVEE